jgi:hypothetical protein
MLHDVTPQARPERLGYDSHIKFFYPKDFPAHSIALKRQPQLNQSPEQMSAKYTRNPFLCQIKDEGGMICMPPSFDSGQNQSDYRSDTVALHWRIDCRHFGCFADLLSFE